LLGPQREAYPLNVGVVTLGRDKANAIALPHASLSRKHAEFSVAGDRVQVRDLNSRNGVKVNGVPRSSAVLQAGDKLKIGTYEFELTAGASSSPRVALAQKPAVEVGPEVTVDHSLALPEGPKERELSVLYHAAFWITESADEDVLAARLCGLLRDGLRAEEAQFFGPDGVLKHFAGPQRAKPLVKLAEFLKTKIQESPEAAVFSGRDLARHQQKVGQFNYLVAPIRTTLTGDGAVPFVVLLRPVDWREYTAEDRVLLQAIVQLWCRGAGRTRQINSLRRDNRQLRQKTGQPTLLGQSAAMTALRSELERAATTRVTVLLEGETGSGKEVVAQYVHENSPRAEASFVKINCAAIPDGLIESELFGHVKGAFTDANANRTGKFQQAHGGTLFLDEIGEMPLHVQPKVLRALENGEIEPLGSEKTTRVDVRIIAATNRDLAAMVARKEFRQDLYYRLNVLKVRVMPLREHVDDMALLADYFLQKFCAENGLAALSFAPAAVTALTRHAWPGNVRELRNVVQRCAISAVGVQITAEIVAAKIAAGEK